MAKRLPDDIDGLRGAIDSLDRRLLEVLNERIECARKIGELKATTGSPVFVAPREKQVLQRLLRQNPGALPRENLLRIYREIFAASRGVETTLRIGYAGPPGSLAHSAAGSLFGRSTKLIARASAWECLTLVARKECDYAVLPSVVAPEGVADHALIHILSFHLYLTAEFHLPLDVGIALTPRRKAVRKVLVPPAFADLAAERLPARLPDAKCELVADIPAAAKGALETRGAAALVPEFTAEELGLVTRYPLLGPGEGRQVRYLVVGREPATPTGADRTTVAFGLVNRAGNLLRALRPFSKRRVNLVLLTASAGGDRSNGDLFFLDLEGHVRSEKIHEALEEMRGVVSFAEVLGSYPVFDLGSRTL